MNELANIDFQQSITIEVKNQGEVIFEGYEALKEQITHLDSLLDQIEVNEDNIKNCKKLVAKIRKKSDEIDKERIRVKKELLIPYQNLELKVKEITSLTKEAEEKVRTQIRGLEEKERQKKYKEIEEIWGKRTQNFEYKFIDFSKWFNQSFLNKTTSLKQIEQNLEEFLVKVETDIKVIDMNDNKDLILKFYVDSYDLSDSMLKAKEHIENEKRLDAIKRQIQFSQGEVITEVLEEMKDGYEKVTIEVDKKDYEKINAFCVENKIGFRVLSV